jgi:hypothetical protein
MLRNSAGQPHDADRIARSDRVNLPPGVRMLLGRFKATFARNRRRRHELERELRHRDAAP